MRYELMVVGNSDNRKLGNGVGVTYRPVGDSGLQAGSCPSTCMFLHHPDPSVKCYTVDGFFTRMHQDRSRTRRDQFDGLIKSKAKLVRHHVTGDCFKHDATHERGYVLDVEYISDLFQFHTDNPDIGGYTYCHDIQAFWQDLPDHHKEWWPANFHLVASVDNAEQRAYAKALGFRTARVIRSLDEIAHGEVFCPYDKALFYGKHNKDIKVRCASCRLCFNEGKQDIAFLLH